jgi:phosphopantothenoylcysteine synthetase/decarboxylase
MNILHGLTGSVASTIVCKFQKHYEEDSVKFVLTESSKKFNPPYYMVSSFDLKLEGQLRYGQFDDDDEWVMYEKGSKVLHIELVKWADVFVIAPCSANTIAKIANGVCDNLLTCVARAWDFEKKFIIAPSMNVKMWEHPITKEHIDKIKSWGITVVDPIEKKLFCGDYGMGAMANIEDIVKQIKNEE